MKNKLSLYIHIPFCNSKCNYCSFVSQVAPESEKIRYIKNLKKEIQLRAQEYNTYYSVRTIYIGGGTPSSLPLGYIKELMQTIYKYFTVDNNAEITMELNPNTVNSEKIREYILSGVNRFSIGLQCSNQQVLKNMGRTHSVLDFDNTIELIRNHGISNINADIMLGYPGQNMRDVTETIKHLIELKIPHISSYMLSVEDGTPLQLMVDKGVKYLPKENVVLKMYQNVVKTLDVNGYYRYEISNFAKPGFLCKHNLVYWKREAYLGLGVAAHSYISGVRFSNTEKLSQYNTCLETKNKPPVIAATKLTKEEMKEEFIMLSLRTEEGLITSEYEKEFNENFILAHKEKLAELIKLKLLIIDKAGNIKATSAGFLVLNKIILELCS